MSGSRIVTCTVCHLPQQTTPGSRVLPLHAAPRGVPIDAAHVRIVQIGDRRVPVHTGKRHYACAGSLQPPSP